MTFVDPTCRAVAARAAGGTLTETEILNVFADIDARNKRMIAEGNLTGRAEKIRKWAAEEGERTKIAAATQKRHAALNILVRDRLNQQIATMVTGGLRQDQALRAVLEGINSPAAGTRASAAAAVQGYEARYLGGMWADIAREKPHIQHMLSDQKFDADIMREMMELRDGGKPGVTGNDDAKWLARTFADYAELSRTELNRLGASIGKLDGWAGPQTHDDMKMIAAGKERWTGYIATKLDLERTFPEGVSSTEAIGILGDIYDTIITGVPAKATPAELGQRVNPANLAKSLGKSRVLHFKDADAALAYRDEFGYSNTVRGMFSHLMHVSKIGGLMETLGPNPEVMFGSISEGLRRDIRDSNLDPAEKKTLIDRLNVEDGALRHAMDVATGLVSRPVNTGAAQIGSNIRAAQSMAKLGGAVISSVGDSVTAAAAAQFRGSGFLRGVMQQWAGILRGRPKGEQAEIAYLVGEGFDGLLGHVVNAGAANDGPKGTFGKLQDIFFKLNGLTWWTDVNRAVAGRVIAAELGMHSGKGFAALPPRFRHVLEQGGIDEAMWTALGQATLRMDNGKPYMTPDLVDNIPGAALVPLAADRIDAARVAARGDAADFQRRVDVIEADVRRQLSVRLAGFIADQTSYSVIEADARTKRYTTMGTRTGTFAGEAVRFIMQFKGYPLAFVSRIGGRALFGHRKDASFLERSGHIGSLLAGLTIAGYMSMSAKDILKGYWPPRNPTDPRTWLAAAQQGGALGIYSDFLFSKVNRFGGGFTETLAGPTIGTLGDLAEIGLGARDLAIDVASGEEGKFSGSQAISWAQGNTPFANLFWVKPVTDYLFMSALREAASPGASRRQEKQRRNEYGQERLWPAAM